MGRYASDTSVSPERSQQQIRDTLRRYGAERFGLMEEAEQAAVMFQVRGLTVRMCITLPPQSEFRYTPERRLRRSERDMLSAHDQAIRQRWRALFLAIKAKLEAVECGISTIEQEFLPFMLMPDGRTVADHLLPRLEQIVSEGRMPEMLALPEPKKGGAA